MRIFSGARLVLAGVAVLAAPAALADLYSALQKAKKLGWDRKDQQSRLATYTESKAWMGNLFAF